MAGATAISYVKAAIDYSGSAEIGKVSNALRVVVRQSINSKRCDNAEIWDEIERVGITSTGVLRQLISQAQGRRPVMAQLKQYNRRGELLRALGGNRDIMCCTW